MKKQIDSSVAKATRQFTDREEPRTAFWKKYDLVKSNLPQNNNHHVITYYGIGGIGKSRLLKEITQELQTKVKEPLYVYYDFDFNQDCRGTLEKIKNQLSRKYDFTFPLFELGSYIYAKKVGDNPNSPQVKQLLGNNPTLNLMKTLVGEIPVVGSLKKWLDIVEKIHQCYGSYLNKHRASLLHINDMDEQQIYDMLPKFFADDLNNNLEGTKEPLVILLDTYERLVNELNQVGEPLKNDEWIRSEKGIVANLPNVLWVIAGREKLKWDKFDFSDKFELEQHILGNLSFADSDSFLQNAGIKDADLRRQIYDLTNGTPVYLDLCVDRYLRMVFTGEKIDISKFGKNTYDLIERFIRYMEPAQKDLVYVMSCMQRWDDDLIREVSQSVLCNFSWSVYNKTKNFSFVIQSEDNGYNIHQTVGEVLERECDIILKREIGEKLFQMFSEKTKSTDLFSAEYLNALLYIARAGILMCGNKDELRVYYENNLRSQLIDFARAGRSGASHRVFSVIFDDVDKNVQSRYYARYLCDLAYFIYLDGDYESAEKIATDGLLLYLDLAGEDDLDTIRAMSNLADTISKVNDRSKIEKMLILDKTVLEKFSKVFPYNNSELLEAKGKLVITLNRLGRYEEALELNEEVLKVRKLELGENHIDTIKAMNHLAISCDGLKRHDVAQKLWKIVVTQRIQKFGESHLATLRSLTSYGSSLFATGDYEVALELRKEVYKKRREILGDLHSDTKESLCYLIESYESIGNMEKANELRKNIT